ncbi:ATP-binding cassette domain-containing protein [Klugiella xanthotipulae]|uniref:ABC-2 type transport system ATP-binding protein n=1 Tax=Klugiella xanthotipulae TaxID=244735 RepID=A0A543I6P4_9MICO|nr:ATP-binding cassette domain-containing protein [Klugiella xanthotipulae]TQM66160.1 ABC-2 type transport system ATP-binding protein [Klugiella xanthotipulae]
MLTLSNISRSFGDRQALTDVSFTIDDGRMTGFVGGNGAGKTTTMRIILGVLAADSGTITRNANPLSSNDRRSFGYMPEERGLYPKMKIEEQLTYLARLHGFSKPAAGKNARALLEELGLGERLNDTVESLSLGNQQRAQIAAALVHQPEVLILDEPFSGLDPMAVDVVLQVLKDRAATGVPVLFSSHQLDVVERLCDDLVIISGGTVRAAGPRDQLREEHSTNRYELDHTGDAGWLREQPGVTVVEFDGGYALFDVDSDATAQAVLHRAMESNTVRSFTPKRPTLAQIFREVVAA